MKVAKASSSDLDMAFDLANAIEGLSGWAARVPEAVEKIDDPNDADMGEPFDPDDSEQCQRVLGHIIDLSQRGSIMRVIMGCAVMLDPRNQCVDPNADTIEHHPHAKAGLEAKKPRPLSDWTPEAGKVLWWRFPQPDTPWLGEPTDPGWPGHHTHWTALVVPEAPPGT